MKKFKDFLVEMGQYLQHYNDRHPSVTNKKPPKVIKSYGEHHSTMDNGYHVHIKHIGDNKEIRVVDPKTKLTHIHLETYSGDNKKHSIQTLSGRKESPVKVHELYHHLITKHDHEFMTHSQSPGGFKVWQKLHKMPGVDIHVHDGNTGKTTKVKNMDDHKDFHHTVTNGDLSHPNTQKYLIAKKSS